MNCVSWRPVAIKKQRGSLHDCGGTDPVEHVRELQQSLESYFCASDFQSLSKFETFEIHGRSWVTFGSEREKVRPNIGEVRSISAFDWSILSAERCATNKSQLYLITGFRALSPNRCMVWCKRIKRQGDSGPLASTTTCVPYHSYPRAGAIKMLFGKIAELRI